MVAGEIVRMQVHIKLDSTLGEPERNAMCVAIIERKTLEDFCKALLMICKVSPVEGLREEKTQRSARFYHTHRETRRMLLSRQIQSGPLNKLLFSLLHLSTVRASSTEVGGSRIFKYNCRHKALRNHVSFAPGNYQDGVFTSAPIASLPFARNFIQVLRLMERTGEKSSHEII
jgi:hypothetical protein